MPWPRVILHVDMDAFFVACEMRRDPSLIGKPVIVGGDPGGRGVVSTASYEARKFGIHSAMPSSVAHRLCPHALFIRGHFNDYVETSRRLHTIFEEMTPAVQMASLDEAYLDLTGTERLWGPPENAAVRLRQRVVEVERLTASVGVATTKCVAKIASDFNKPDGMTIVQPGEEVAFLAPLPLRRLPGVGPKSFDRLAAFGVRTIGDLAAMGEAKLNALFGDPGRSLWARSVGKDRGEVETDTERKSLGRETTFDVDVTDAEALHATLSRLAEDIGTRLRRKGLSAHRVTLKLRSPNFHTITRAKTLPQATNLELDLLHAGRDLLKRNWKPGQPIRLIGLTTSGLVSDELQMDLLGDERREREIKLSQALDSIRERHGRGVIRRGTSAPPRGDGNLPPWETGGRMQDDV